LKYAPTKMVHSTITRIQFVENMFDNCLKDLKHIQCFLFAKMIKNFDGISLVSHRNPTLMKAGLKVVVRSSVSMRN